MVSENDYFPFMRLYKHTLLHANSYLAIVVFMATKQGEATLGAVTIILVLLFCLYQVQWCIKDISL